MNMEVFDAKERAEGSGHKPAKKGGRKPKLTEQQKRANRLKSCKKYRDKIQDEYKRSEAENKSMKEKMEGLQSNINSSNEELSEAKALVNKLEADLSARSKLVHELKKENEALNTKIEQLQQHILNLDVQDEYKRSEAENKSLKEKMEVLHSKMEVQQSEINSLNKELSETKARAYKLETELSVQSEYLNKVKLANEAVEPGIQQLQQHILDKDDEDDLDFNNIPMDPEFLNSLENLKVFNKNTGCLFGEGTSIAETKLSPLHETVNVEGFRVLKENSPMIQEIFRKYPNTASGLRFRHQASRNCFMNILAEVHKMATIDVEKCNLEEIEHMEVCIKDLESAGLNISWLKNSVAECREEVEEKEKIKSMEAKVKSLKERQAKRAEERELSKRRRVM